MKNISSVCLSLPAGTCSCSSSKKCEWKRRTSDGEEQKSSAILLSCWCDVNIHNRTVQMDTPQPVAVRLSRCPRLWYKAVLGALEEGFLIGYDYLYLCFRNDAVARGGFEFLTLKDPRREISAEMCSRSYIPEPLLSLVEELLMLTHALTLCIQPASSVRRSTMWTPFNKILLLFIPPSLRLSDS